MKKIALLALVLPFVPVFAEPLSKPLAELVATERRFSATCGQKGIRDSFLDFFADEVVTFGSELRNGKARLQGLPADFPDGPKLQWEPVYGDISAAGDLGYTTGPYIRTTKTGETSYGMFFSIWKRQPQGNWKVILDAGLPTPKPDGAMGREFQPAPRVQHRKKVRVDPSSGREQLRAVERRFAEEAEKEGLGKALSIYGDPSLRLHRAGFFPITDREHIAATLNQNPLSYKSELLGSGISSSGDLGFVYGSCQAEAAGTTDRCFYVRVWRRNGRGEWRLVLDSMHPVPKN